jgi:glycogen synthase
MITLFEVSWEVCNKVGGIYTVVTSKAARVLEQYPNYILIGPYIPESTPGIFHEEPVPERFEVAFKGLEKDGIICHYGKWLIESQPQVVLLEFSKFMQYSDGVKKDLWEHFKVDSLFGGYDYTEPIMFSYAAGKLIEELKSRSDASFIAQFHEWICGAGLLYLKQHCKEVATVFTTHATILGRSLSSSGFNIYEQHNGQSILTTFDPEQKAREHGILPKFSMERASAQNADCFTTVSEITALEAKYLLGRDPDLLLPNGLDSSKFPTFEETSIKHRLNRNQMREFCLAYFFPYTSFDIENTLFFVTAGRYEFRDKGLDIFIKSLNQLNKRLKEENTEKNVVAFFFVPSGTRAIRNDLFMHLTHYEDIKDSVDQSLIEIKQKILFDLVAQKPINRDTIFPHDFMLPMQSKLERFKSGGNAPLCTHKLINEDEDAILNTFKAEELINKPEDKVKVIFYPIYLNGADNLLDLDYFETLSAAHLGVFPSFYEPWGYTPLECSALGTPALTTDLSGFGRHIRQIHSEVPGIKVIKREQCSDEDAVSELANYMHHFTKLSSEERVQYKISAKELSKKTDWKELIKNYLKAYEFALGKVHGP